jgi:hypothetical protein
MPNNLEKGIKHPYICTVFFMVLDLRLRKIGYREITFFCFRAFHK